VRRIPMSLAVLSLLMACAAARAQLVMGAVGDSLSDEYFEETYSYARNWVSHLAVSRGVSFGPTAAAGGQPGGTWGEPRRTGFRFNWARSGANSQTLLQQGQHTGLAALAGPGNITHGVVFVGANNFHYGLFGTYFNIYNNVWSQQQIESHLLSTAADIVQSISTLESAGLRVVLVNIPDYGFSPTMRSLYTSAARRQRVTNAIDGLNAMLDDIAATRGLMIVDAFGLMQAVAGTHAAPTPIVLIGNRPIDLDLADTSANARPWAGFVHDGVHPHTTLQGVLANVIITALNMGHSAGMQPLSEAEILASANLTYGGHDTLAAHIGAYSAFVANYACPANCDNSTEAPILNIEDFTCFINAFASAQLLPHAQQINHSANCDQSTTAPVLNIEDFTCFINAFAAGCR
jgi:phospholipase/lecithinase/hemolysin